MNILLINPPTVLLRAGAKGQLAKNLFYNSPPLGLAYLAAVLEEKGHQVVIDDGPLLGWGVEEMAERVRTQRPDLIGFTSTTPYFENARAAAAAIRRACPDVPICIGGPHVNSSPEILLKDDLFDFAVKGEGERTLVEVVGRMEQGEQIDDVAGVVTRREGGLHIGPERPLMENLDELPFPARHLLPIHRYIPLPNDQYELPKTAMITSRGCPYRCTFCHKQTFGSRYRGASAGRIVEEMHHLVDRFNIRDIAFVDSTFIPNAKRISAILDAMEANPPGTSWTCSCRADVMTEEILRRMKANGCWRVRFGIESGNEGILEQIQKGVTKEQIVKAVFAADRAGLQLKAFFMIGHVGETRQTLEESIRFACSLPLKDITVQINTPLPGTPQYDGIERHGILKTDELDRYDFFSPVFIPSGMTAEELIRSHKRFYRRFYLRPSVLWRHLKSFRGLGDLGKYLRALPLVVHLLFTRKASGS